MCSLHIVNLYNIGGSYIATEFYAPLNIPYNTTSEYALGCADFVVSLSRNSLQRTETVRRIEIY